MTSHDEATTETSANVPRRAYREAPSLPPGIEIARGTTLEPIVDVANRDRR